MARRDPRQVVAQRAPGRWTAVAVAQGGASFVVFLVLAVLVPLTGLGVWSIPAIIGGTLVSLVIELSFDVRARGRALAAGQDEIEDLRERVDDLEPFASRVQELEAGRVQLEETVQALRANIEAPRSLAAMLGDIAKQDAVLQLVRRHRTADPRRQPYPVTDVSRSGPDAAVEVQAHTGTPLEVTSEPVALLFEGEVASQGSIVESAGAVVTAAFSAESLPPEIQLPLDRGGKPSVEDLGLVLLGFTVPVYRDLTDRDLEAVASVYGDATTTIARLFFGGADTEEQEDLR